MKRFSKDPSSKKSGLRNGRTKLSMLFLYCTAAHRKEKGITVHVASEMSTIA